MEKGKITEIGIKYNYGFYNGGFIKFKIGKIEHLWHSTDRLIEEFCMKLGIYKEDDMQRLKDKWFYIHDYEYFEDGDYKCEIEIINKKVNPENKKFWIYVKN